MRQLVDALRQARAEKRRLRCLGKKREKVFGPGRADPLDGNAKARIWAYAQSYTASRREKGQHRGPLTRGFLEVLWRLLYSFHNQHTGRCFPSYEAIAEKAHVHRSTVNEAIHALENARVLTWETRLVRQRVAVDGLFGKNWILVPRRTSNAYRFLDPKPEDRPLVPKSENSTGSGIKVLFSIDTTEKVKTEARTRLDAALERLGNAIQLREREAESP